MPRRRRKLRTGPPHYPLLPTIRFGRSFGRPQPRRLTAPLLINASNAVASWRWPGVNNMVSGLPRPSVRTWPFVLKPPRLRPSASASGVVFCPSGVLMGAHNRAIDEVDFPVQLALGITLSLQLHQNTLPDATLPPAVVTTGHRTPLTIPFGQVSRGSTCPQDPEDPIDDLPMVKIWSTYSWFLRWQQQF
jgi:hypothetical protein